MTEVETGIGTEIETGIGGQTGIHGTETETETGNVHTQNTPAYTHLLP